MKKTVFVVGPTASGKTEYAIRLAEHFDGEIVSADSMQIYKHLDIGSAKPSPEQLRRIRHHLIGEIEPTENFSVAEYKQLAEGCIDQIFRSGKVPFVCGGTGLYVNALLYDMDFSAAPGSREHREHIFSEIGGEEPGRLHARLCELDPEAARTIHPNNIKRILRAIERLESGREDRLTPFRRKRVPNKAFSSIVIGIARERQILYKRIEARVDRLLEEGLESEVRSLLSMGLSEDHISMKGIGYKEMIPYVKGHISLEQAATEIKTHTRRYAKRQMTWFGSMPEITWFSAEEADLDEAVLQEMIRHIHEKRVPQ